MRLNYKNNLLILFFVKLSYNHLIFNILISIQSSKYSICLHKFKILDHYNLIYLIKKNFKLIIAKLLNNKINNINSQNHIYKLKKNHYPKKINRNKINNKIIYIHYHNIHKKIFKINNIILKNKLEPKEINH
jgi:hypothetical protein